jgi:hypothetical protein
LPKPDPLVSLTKSRAVDISWGRTVDRTARTAPAREAADARFLAMADGDPKRAQALRRAFYKQLTIKSLRARARRKAEREAAEAKSTSDADAIAT